mmetsp:Transcript_55735/g.174565  ORF Transcript_55735/g.174565 Transcript_55735/m.174565 type:complete len:202 (+) Transcript_55735:219-824(+)
MLMSRLPCKAASLADLDCVRQWWHQRNQRACTVILPRSLMTYTRLSITTRMVRRRSSVDWTERRMAKCQAAMVCALNNLLRSLLIRMAAIRLRVREAARKVRWLSAAALSSLPPTAAQAHRATHRTCSALSAPAARNRAWAKLKALRLRLQRVPRRQHRHCSMLERRCCKADLPICRCSASATLRRWRAASSPAAALQHAS